MGLIILAAFIAVPLIEIGLFVQVGGAIGLWPTLAVVVLTAVAGTALLRHQGLGTLGRLQASMDRGEMPLEPVFDGFCLLAAGALLLTPGFFTDAVGFALFVPAVRRLLRGFFASRVQVHTQHAHMHGDFPGTRSGENPFRSGPDGDVIDGDFEDVTDHPGSGDPRGRIAPKSPPPKSPPHDRSDV